MKDLTIEQIILLLELYRNVDKEYKITDTLINTYNLKQLKEHGLIFYKEDAIFISARGSEYINLIQKTIRLVK